MDEDTRRLPALLTNPTNNGAPNNGAANDANALKADYHVIVASPGIASDSSSKPQRRRNKPSLSCGTCTVSHHYIQVLFVKGEEEGKREDERTEKKPPTKTDSNSQMLTVFRLKRQRSGGA